MLNPYTSQPLQYPHGPSYQPGGFAFHPLPGHAQHAPGRSSPTTGHMPATAVPANYHTGTLDVQQKRRRSVGQQSGESEVEAGLALAGMGSSMSAEDSSARRPSDSVDEAGTAKRKGGKKAKAVEDRVADDAGKPKPVLAKKSCAECRRMKAKCDRVFPCSNCRKRGCALACPDQDLSCMQGKRLVLASTEELHDRISELEAALALAQRQIDTSPHPLLAGENNESAIVGTESPLGRTSIKSEQLGAEDARRLSPTQRSSSHSSFVLRTPLPNEHFGDRGQQGRMAVENLLIDEGNIGTEGKREDDWVGENAAPALIVGNAATTEDSVDRQAILNRLRSIVRVLPDRETTQRQAERFWSQSTWYQNILRREEFEAIYESAVYSPSPSNPLTPHKLACVLMLLTLDTYFDVGGSQDNPLIGEYWGGVQKCFDTSFGWGASVAGVQALGLASLFVGFGWRGAGASNFYWLRQMTSAAQQLGLHKDPHPSISPTEQTFRRRVFHEAYTLDCLMSINHGQRTAIPHDSIEATYPDDNMPLCKLKYMYMGHVKRQVIEIGCAPESVSKAELEDRVSQLAEMLDKYRCVFALDTADGSMERQPQVHCPVLTGAPLPPPPSDPSHVDVKSLTQSTTSMCHFKSLLFLHRPSLRRLIGRLREKTPSSRQPLTVAERTCIQQTFLASTSIIAISGFIARHEPRLAARLWSTWVQTFSAAVSLAALAIWCGPFMDDGFVQRAYEEMRGGCDMIRDNGCDRAQGVLSLLPILCTLVENRYPRLSLSNSPATSAVQQGEDMLFVLLGGRVDFDKSAPASIAPTPQLAHTKVDSAQATPGAFWNQINFGPSDPLPVHWLQPSPAPDTSFPPFGLPQQLSNNLNLGQNQNTQSQSSGLGGLDPNQPFAGMDTAEIWARLQTFYEPAMAVPFWAAGAGGQMPEQGGGGGTWGYEGAEFGVY